MKFKELGVNPEDVKSIAAKVKDTIAYAKGKNLTPEEIAAYAVKTHAKKDVSPEDMKKKVAKVMKVMEKVNSGEIDIKKYTAYADKFGG